MKRTTVALGALAANALFSGYAHAYCPVRLEATVLFGTGRIACEPTSEDCSAFAAILDDAYDIWSGPGGGVVHLVGYSDTLASPEQSQILSEQRAAFVRDQLIARGIPAEQIESEGRGETELARLTADSVAEILNNRVVIDLSDGARRSAEQARQTYERDVAAALAAGIEPPPRPNCL